MRHISTIQIVATVIILSLLVIFQQTYRISFSTVDSRRGTFAPENPISCKIWPNDPTLNPTYLKYTPCHATIKSPHVGNLSVLGSPYQCLGAAARFDQYHELAGHNWSGVTWGMHTFHDGITMLTCFR
jgi:hypothetical protein